jgi:DNA-directed RNA polymerase subunit RPC12/RpoP
MTPVEINNPFRKLSIAQDGASHEAEGIAVTCAHCGRELGRQILLGFEYYPEPLPDRCPQCGYEPPPPPLWPFIAVFGIVSLAILAAGVGIGLWLRRVGG